MPRITQYKKQLYKARNDVHKYLDGIWLISSKPGKARKSMYTWLGTQLGVSEEDAHVSKFDLSTCRKAIEILRPKFIQLHGYDICEEGLQMYYLRKPFNIKGTLSFQNDDNIYTYELKVEIYCKNKTLNNEGMIQDYDDIRSAVIEKLNGKYINDVFTLNPTYENIARWICEQIMTAYKVKVIDEFGNEVIYEEDEN